MTPHPTHPPRQVTLSGNPLLKNIGILMCSQRAAQEAGGSITATTPEKLTVVQSTQRSRSPSIIKKGQFSHPLSMNCPNSIIVLCTILYVVTSLPTDAGVMTKAVRSDARRLKEDEQNLEPRMMGEENSRVSVGRMLRLCPSHQEFKLF